MLEHFNGNIIYAMCNQGQKKLGVDQGGSVFASYFNLNINKTIIQKEFSNVNSIINNGYRDISSEIYQSQIKSHRTLLLGGDHSIGIGSVDGLLKVYGDNLRILWLDAHADINDHSTSLSGNLHGMSLGYHYQNTRDKPIWNIENKRIKPNQLYYYGIRDMDPAEIKLIMTDKIGFSTQLDNNLGDFIQNAQYLAISFDVDVLDPLYLDSTGTLAENGAKPEDIKSIFNIVQKKTNFVHLDIVEINPLLGDWDKSIKTLDYIFS